MREFSKNGTFDYGYNGKSINLTQFLVTEEPFEDSDPNVASVVAGTELVSSFG